MGKHVEWYNAAGERYCSGCQTYMDVALFQRGAPTADGLQRYCRVCRRGHRRRWYQRNRLASVRATRAWEATHPEQARATQRASQRAYRLRKSLENGAFARRVAREAQRAADVALVRRLLRAEPTLTPQQVAERTGWYYSKARRLLLRARTGSDGRAGERRALRAREEQAG